jgi:hypothetical protein
MKQLSHRQHAARAVTEAALGMAAVATLRDGMLPDLCVLPAMPQAGHA